MAILRVIALFLSLVLGCTQTYAMVCETACVKTEFEKEAVPDCHKTENEDAQESQQDCCMALNTPQSLSYDLNISNQESPQTYIFVSQNSIALLDNLKHSQGPPLDRNISFHSAPLYLVLSKLKIPSHS